jgi:2-hydroxy-6-oxonona-2,4-dienedioate hydrolase
VIIGASAGAPSALQFALRYPERVSRLVLMVPAVYVPRPNQGSSVTTPPATQFLFDTALRSDFLSWAATGLVRRTLIESILATPARVVDEASAKEQERMQETLDSILPIRPRRIGLVNDASVTSALPRYELERVAAPTLAISCADDRFGTYDAARYTSAHIPKAHFIGVSQALAIYGSAINGKSLRRSRNS